VPDATVNTGLTVAGHQPRPGRSVLVR